MLAAVETAWLFTRAGESVRIIRAATLDGEVHLHVHGPGTARHSHTFHDVMECMQFQSDIERRLVAQGFALERFTSDRRAVKRRDDGDPAARIKGPHPR